MADSGPVEFSEDRVPSSGIEEAISELVELYGGEMKEERARERQFVLPLRRGVATSGGVQCTLSWAVGEGGEGDEATVKLVCDRDIDAPKAQRIAMLVAGVIGSMFFMIWPFFPHTQELGTLAWMGGIVAIAVYFLSLKRSSRGLAFDFLQRLANRQRAMAEVE